MNNTISVIIPCYNEGPRVALLVRHVFSVFDNNVQVIVSDQSNDQIISNSLQKYDDLNFIYTTSPGNCRAETMNHGAKFATGDIFLFLHADNQLPLEAKAELEQMNIDEYIGGCFQEYAHPNMTLLGLLEVYRNRQTMVTKIYFGANAMWITKELFHHLGGFAYMKLFEDADLNDKLRLYAKINNKKLHISQYITLISSRKFKERGFRTIFFLQIKLIVLYRLGLYSDNFQKEYYKK